MYIYTYTCAHARTYLFQSKSPEQTQCAERLRLVFFLARQRGARCKADHEGEPIGAADIVDVCHKKGDSDFFFMFFSRWVPYFPPPPNRVRLRLTQNIIYIGMCFLIGFFGVF